jgi:hypothetical protein
MPALASCRWCRSPIYLGQALNRVAADIANGDRAFDKAMAARGDGDYFDAALEYRGAALAAHFLLLGLHLWCADSVAGVLAGVNALAAGGGR